MRLYSLVACVVMTAAPAAADDYPPAFIDRQLTLDPGMLQAAASIGVLHNGAAMDPAPSNIEALEIGGDYTLLKHLQVGGVVDIALSPSSDFQRGLASGQYQFLNFAAIRIDLGAQRVDNGDLYFAFGAGLPLRLKLTETVAIISSRPYAYGAEDDIFSVRAGGSTISEIRIPAGVLYQLDKHVALVGRTGFRNQGSAYFVPLGADLWLSISRLDIGVTLDLAGQVSPDNGNGYFDLLTVRAFAQLRI